MNKFFIAFWPAVFFSASPAWALQYQFHSPSITCGGCAKTIEKTLTQDGRVSSVKVNVKEKLVTVETQGDATLTGDEVTALLQKKHYDVKDFKQLN
ncbi:MAG: heavy-metal-associated domain-containing protein [Bdellovibrionales bacterium]|nr:heavy-metal-associated domain-containing protein [Bdellovibrionales bacterium]